MAFAGAKRLALVVAGITFLTACEEGSGFNPFANTQSGDPGTSADPVAESTTIIERDVESPAVFQQTEKGLWDGRPSLGGVWVAHPDVTDPERVIIRNQANDKFVIGALFRRERENPGPRFQVSADAAAALGMLAGAPNVLNVTALRREEVPVVPEVSAPTVDTLETAEVIEQQPLPEPVAEPVPETVAETVAEPPLDPVAALAASAIEAATATTAAAAPVKPAATVAPVTTAAIPDSSAPLSAIPAQKSSLEKPFIQIGIFSIETNAQQTADLLRGKGIVPMVKKSASNGKEYWRVIVGPAANGTERSAVLSTVRDLGFADAYAVTN